jgi:hypothetical protein
VTDALQGWQRLIRGKVNDMLMHGLVRLGQELKGPRLSALHSTLGLAVPRAALHSLGGGMTGEATSNSPRIDGDRRRSRFDRR